jgi:hypothetical protein
MSLIPMKGAMSPPFHAAQRQRDQRGMTSALKMIADRIALLRRGQLHHVERAEAG